MIPMIVVIGAVIAFMALVGGAAAYFVYGFFTLLVREIRYMGLRSILRERGWPEEAVRFPAVSMTAEPGLAPADLPRAVWRRLPEYEDYMMTPPHPGAADPGGRLVCALVLLWHLRDTAGGVGKPARRRIKASRQPRWFREMADGLGYGTIGSAGPGAEDALVTKGNSGAVSDAFLWGPRTG